MAGCAGDDATPKAVVASTTVLARGDLQGTVLDDEDRPIAGVLVRGKGPVDSGEARTNEEGAYYIERLTAGVNFVSFTHPRFEALEHTVTIKANDVATDDATLSLLPSFRPYRDILPPMNGRYTCAQEAVIFTGDCMILWEFATQQPDTFTTETYALRFPVGAGWNQLVVQLDWDTGANNQLDGMHLYLSPANETQDLAGHHTKLAVAEGANAPLRLDLFPGKPGPGAEPYPGSTTPAQIPATGLDVLGLVYPRGHGAETTEQVCEPGTNKCFLGLGIGFEVSFTLYAGIAYNGDVFSESFTMLPP